MVRLQKEHFPWDTMLTPREAVSIALQTTHPRAAVLYQQALWITTSLNTTTCVVVPENFTQPHIDIQSRKPLVNLQCQVKDLSCTRELVCVCPHVILPYSSTVDAPIALSGHNTMTLLMTMSSVRSTPVAVVLTTSCQDRETSCTAMSATYYDVKRSKVSLVIPVANVSDTLARCFKNIIAEGSSSQSVLTALTALRLSTPFDPMLIEKWPTKLKIPNKRLPRLVPRLLALSRRHISLLVRRKVIWNAKLMLIEGHQATDIQHITHHSGPREVTREATFGMRPPPNVMLSVWSTNNYSHPMPTNQESHLAQMVELPLAMSKMLSQAIVLPHMRAPPWIRPTGTVNSRIRAPAWFQLTSHILHTFLTRLFESGCSSIGTN